jgi:hypothetical protein
MKRLFFIAIALLAKNGMAKGPSVQELMQTPDRFTRMLTTLTESHSENKELSQALAHAQTLFHQLFSEGNNEVQKELHTMSSGLQKIISSSYWSANKKQAAVLIFLNTQSLALKRVAPKELHTTINALQQATSSAITPALRGMRDRFKRIPWIKLLMLSAGIAAIKSDSVKKIGSSFAILGSLADVITKQIRQGQSEYLLWLKGNGIIAQDAQDASDLAKGWKYGSDDTGYFYEHTKNKSKIYVPAPLLEKLTKAVDKLLMKDSSGARLIDAISGAMSSSQATYGNILKTKGFITNANDLRSFAKGVSVSTREDGAYIYKKGKEEYVVEPSAIDKLFVAIHSLSTSDAHTPHEKLNPIQQTLAGVGNFLSGKTAISLPVGKAQVIGRG